MDVWTWGYSQAYAAQVQDEVKEFVYPFNIEATGKF